jgi:proliferating cell nuclear antigen PCNA
MIIELNNLSKCVEFTTIFKHLYKFTTFILLDFDKNGLKVQGMDPSKSCVFELNIKNDWFDKYEILDEIEYNIGVNANILSKIFGIHNENQCICISYDNELENILLTFKSENFFTKEFNIPLVDVDDNKLDIHAIDYDVEFTIATKLLDNMINELKIFNSDLNVNCNENLISLNCEGVEGSMKCILYDSINDNDYINDYSCTENINLNLTYSIKLFSMFCCFEKLSHIAKLEFGEDSPMRIYYKFGEQNYLAFYLTSKIVDDYDD